MYFFFSKSLFHSNFYNNIYNIVYIFLYFYYRLVELGKSQLKTRQEDRKMGPETFIRKTKNKTGVIETRIIACRECGEEFCDGNIYRPVRV